MAEPSQILRPPSASLLSPSSSVAACESHSAAPGPASYRAEPFRIAPRGPQAAHSGRRPANLDWADLGPQAVGVLLATPTGLAWLRCVLRSAAQLGSGQQHRSAPCRGPGGGPASLRLQSQPHLDLDPPPPQTSRQLPPASTSPSSPLPTPPPPPPPPVLTISPLTPGPGQARVPAPLPSQPA